jgi:hypothetical protein
MDTAREYQQDQHVRTIMTWLHTASQDDHLPEFVAVAHALLNQIAPHSPRSPSPDACLGNLTLTKIDEFTQDPAERSFLIGRVLARVCESITMRTSHAWVVRSLTAGQAEPTAL